MIRDINRNQCVVLSFVFKNTPWTAFVVRLSSEEVIQQIEDQFGFVVVYNCNEIDDENYAEWLQEKYRDWMAQGLNVRIFE